jgi:hypothetical protein
MLLNSQLFRAGVLSLFIAEGALAADNKVATPDDIYDACNASLDVCLVACGGSGLNYQQCRNGCFDAYDKCMASVRTTGAGFNATPINPATAADPGRAPPSPAQPTPEFGIFFPEVAR